VVLSSVFLAAASLPDTFNEREKRKASEGRKRGQEVLEKQRKKKGTRPFKEEEPSGSEPFAQLTHLM
jgi:hypothetical protein